MEDAIGWKVALNAEQARQALREWGEDNRNPWLQNAYGKALAELGAQNPNIVVLDADLSKSTKTALFGERFPERFFNMGIAEQNMIGVAAGLAAAGKIPFASTFAVFAPGRVFDQIRNSIAYADLNVKIAASHAGLTVSADGASHQAVEDIALVAPSPYDGDRPRRWRAGPAGGVCRPAPRARLFAIGASQGAGGL